MTLVDAATESKDLTLASANVFGRVLKPDGTPASLSALLDF